MWFGTMNGVNRYDGYTVVCYHGPEPETDMVPRGPANVLCEWEGRLWVGWDSRGLTWYDEGTGLFRTPDFNQPAYAVTALQVGSGSRLWIGTGRGLFMLTHSDGVLKHSPAVDPLGKMLSGAYVSALCCDDRDRLWVATYAGVYRWDPVDGSVQHFGRTDHSAFRIASDSVKALCNAADGGVWIGTANGLTYYAEGIDCRSFLAGEDITSLAMSHQGDLWVGTQGDGITVYDVAGGEVHAQIRPDMSRRDMIHSGKIRSLCPDSFGGMWVGTADAGVARAASQEPVCQIYPLETTPVGQNAIWSLFAPMAGQNVRLYAGVQDGVLEFDSRMRSKHSWRSAYPVRTILQDHAADGSALWAGTLGDGLVRLQQGRNGLTETGHYMRQPQARNESTIYALFRDRQDTIWVATNGAGLYAFRGTPEHVTHQELIDGRDSAVWVMSMCEDSTGALWAGTWKQGVWCRPRAGGSFVKVRMSTMNDRRLIWGSVFSLQCDREDGAVIWLGMNGQGLVRYDTRTGRAVIYTERDGLPDNTIYGIVQDESGLIWVSTNNGIAMIDHNTRTVLRCLMAGSSARAEFNLGAWCGGLTGSVFFGGPGGFVEFETGRRGRGTPPSIVLASIATRDGREILRAHVHSRERIELGYGIGPLLLTFTALHYEDPAHNMYSFRSVGKDTSWCPATTLRTLELDSLSAGEHVVEARAVTPDGVWSVEPIRLTLVVAPPLWDTWGFRITAGVVVVTGLAGGSRARIRRRRERQRSMQEERALLRRKLAIDFHDDFGARAAKISMAANLLAGDTREIPGGFERQLHILASDAEKLSREMREMTWEIDPGKDSLMDLATYLKEYSDELFDSTMIAFSLRGIAPEFERSVVPMDMRHHIVRIFKEGMTNALKHARGCHHISLAFTLDGSVLEIALQDDGMGFVDDTAPRGNGLHNMHERARVLGGTLSVSSVASRGTRIALRVKLP
jgi:ligand-binding sensor domain-containing protein/signal transduction histidine kinase